MTDTTAAEVQYVDGVEKQNVKTTVIIEPVQPMVDMEPVHTTVKLEPGQPIVEMEPVQTMVKTEGNRIMLMLIKFPCRPNMSYFGTVLGRLKLTQLVLGVVCFVCAVPESVTGTQFFLVIVVKSFFVSLAWCLIHVLSIREACNKCSKCINWSLTELINSSIMTTLYFAATFVQLSSWVDGTSAVKCIRALNLIAGTVGVFNTLVYATVCVLLFNKWSASRSASREASREASRTDPARRPASEAESVYYSVDD